MGCSSKEPGNQVSAPSASSAKFGNAVFLKTGFVTAITVRPGSAPLASN